MRKKGTPQKETKDSTPPGVLNSDQTARFKTTQEDVAELPIESIQPHLFIPDYKDPTESTLPIVVQSPAGSYCIDGWNLIEQAKAAGQPAIRCYIFHLQEHSDTELAIRKVAIRTKPLGGTGSFAELVRNTKIVVKYLKDKMKNPIVFSHGGARQGTNFTDNKEDDLRQVLSERLGKERSTINDYMAFGRHLSDDALDIHSHHKKADSNKKVDLMLKEFEEGRKDPFHYEAKPYGKIIFVTLSPIIKNGEFVGCVQTVRLKNAVSENE